MCMRNRLVIVMGLCGLLFAALLGVAGSAGGVAAGKLGAAGPGLGQEGLGAVHGFVVSRLMSREQKGYWRGWCKSRRCLSVQ